MDKGHGRLEQRSIKVIAILDADLGIPGIKQAARLRRTREILKWGKKSEETVFLITNLSYDQLDAQEFLRLKRAYWTIENQLHHRKGLVFGEDRSTIRAGRGPQNMSALRNFAIGLLLANGIGNVKRCVDNLQHNPCAFLREAA